MGKYMKICFIMNFRVDYPLIYAIISGEYGLFAMVNGESKTIAG